MQRKKNYIIIAIVLSLLTSVLIYELRAPSKIVERVVESAYEGDVNTQFGLGMAYYSGVTEFDIPQDYAKAIEWFEKAANQDHTLAQYQLAEMYKEGIGIPQNYIKAFEWYEKAANQNYVLAQYSLAEMYKNGKGVAQNQTIALEWYERAASQGYALAHDWIGDMYKKGEGVPLNYITAYAHFSIAIALGFEHRKNKLDELQRIMTIEEISAAQILAEEMWKNLPKN